MDAKHYISILAGIAVLLGGIIVFRVVEAPSKEITNFEECVATGNPIRETYPEQCSAGGKVFTRDISGEDDITDDTDTTPPPSILPYNSGIRGIVMIGPTCPVVQFPPTGECDDKPYEATIDIFNTNGTRFAVVHSSKEGRFEISLPPGTYTLKPASPASRIPYAGEQTVKVPATGYVEVSISYDSGIR